MRHFQDKVEQLGHNTTKYHQILANVLPSLKGRDIHKNNTASRISSMSLGSTNAYHHLVINKENNKSEAWKRSQDVLIIFK